MKYNKLLIILILVASVLAGCTNNNKNENVSNEQEDSRGTSGGPPALIQQESEISVEVEEVIPANFTVDYETIGKLYAGEKVEVSSESNGKVVSINYDVGDSVNKGDILYTIDNEDIKTNVNLQISQLQKNLEDSKINYEDALNKYNNDSSLYGKEIITKDDLDSSEKALKQAKLEYEQAQKNYQSNTKTLNSSVNDTIITSPISGIVSERNIEVGEISSTNDFIIVNLNPMIVKVSVSEEAVNKISKNDKVIVTIDSTDYEGIITTVNPVGEDDTNMYPIEIKISDNDYKLKPGMFANITIPLEKLENQILVPKNSIIIDNNISYVYIVEDNKPKLIEIEQGITKNGYTQIFGEIKKGNLLVIEGQDYLNENSSVKIANVDASST